MIDEIVHVTLPSGASQIHRREGSSNKGEIHFERDVFAASAVRRIGNTPWSLRFPYSADGIWYFDIFYRGSFEPEHPVYSNLLCLNEALAHDFWKVTMLINFDQTTMPASVPWLCTMEHDNAHALANDVYQDGQKLQRRVAWTIIQRAQA